MSERISIDTKRYHLLEESGLRAPGQRWTYRSPEVQRLVQAAFGDLLPVICFSEDEIPYFEAFDESGRELCSLSQHIQSGEDVPRSETIRLLEGYLNMQVMAQDPMVEPRLRAIAGTFRLPHPVRERRFYRLYTDLQGETRLLVLWGFGGKAAARSTVPVGEALACLLGTSAEEISTVVREECTTRLCSVWPGADQPTLAAAGAKPTRRKTTIWRLPFFGVREARA